MTRPSFHPEPAQAPRRPALPWAPEQPFHWPGTVGSLARFRYLVNGASLQARRKGPDDHLAIVPIPSLDDRRVVARTFQLPPPILECHHLRKRWIYHPA